MGGSCEAVPEQTKLMIIIIENLLYTWKHRSESRIRGATDLQEVEV